MRRLAALATLLTLTLTLAACMPDPPQVVLSVINEQASACTTMRATLTYANGTIEAASVEPGEHREVTGAAPTVTHGKPATVEAWCETNVGTGYARLEGDLAELTSRATPIFIYPPGTDTTCRTDLTTSTNPAPCISTNAIH